MRSGQISHYLNIPSTTVRRTIAKGYQEGKKNKCRERHPKNTKLQDESMVEEASKNHHTTYFGIAKKVAHNVSTKTVKRRIEQKNLKKCVAQERVYLDEDLTQERLEWALAYRHWTREMWRRKAMWGGEVSVIGVEERGENGYLDTQMRSEIRIVLNLLLGEGREGLAR